MLLLLSFASVVTASFASEAQSAPEATTRDAADLSLGARNSRSTPFLCGSAPTGQSTILSSSIVRFIPGLFDPELKTDCAAGTAAACDLLIDRFTRVCPGCVERIRAIQVTCSDRDFSPECSDPFNLDAKLKSLSHGEYEILWYNKGLRYAWDVTIRQGLTTNPVPVLLNPTVEELQAVFFEFIRVARRRAVSRSGPGFPWKLFTSSVTYEAEEARGDVDSGTDTESNIEELTPLENFLWPEFLMTENPPAAMLGLVEYARNTGYLAVRTIFRERFSETLTLIERMCLGKEIVGQDAHNAPEELETADSCVQEALINPEDATRALNVLQSYRQRRPTSIKSEFIQWAPGWLPLHPESLLWLMVTRFVPNEVLMRRMMLHFIDTLPFLFNTDLREICSTKSIQQCAEILKTTLSLLGVLAHTRDICRSRNEAYYEWIFRSPIAGEASPKDGGDSSQVDPYSSAWIAGDLMISYYYYARIPDVLDYMHVNFKKFYRLAGRACEVERVPAMPRGPFLYTSGLFGDPERHELLVPLFKTQFELSESAFHSFFWKNLGASKSDAEISSHLENFSAVLKLSGAFETLIKEKWSDPWSRHAYASPRGSFPPAFLAFKKWLRDYDGTEVSARRLKLGTTKVANGVLSSPSRESSNEVLFRNLTSKLPRQIEETFTWDYIMADGDIPVRTVCQICSKAIKPGGLPGCVTPCDHYFHTDCMRVPEAKTLTRRCPRVGCFAKLPPQTISSANGDGPGM